MHPAQGPATASAAVSPPTLWEVAPVATRDRGLAFSGETVPRKGGDPCRNFPRRLNSYR